MSDRLLPSAEGLNGEFYGFLARGELRLQRCTACGACLVTCPTSALVPAPRRPSVVDARCTDCLACVEVCPVDAIKRR